MRKRSSELLAAFALICGVAAAQPAAADQTASVAGRVTSSVTGEGVPRAHVVLRPQSDPSQQSYGAITDPDGKFSIIRVPPGSYSFSADKVGYQPLANPFGATAIPMKLDAGGKKEDANLKLTPGGAVLGRVTDPEGEPVEGVMVRISGIGNNSGTTDNKGQFRIGGLRPGRYRVWAFEPASSLPFPPETRTDDTQEAHYIVTYYPSAPTAKTAATVSVAAGGETSGIAIRLLKSPIVRISGKIVGLPNGIRTSVQMQPRVLAGRVPFGPVRPDGTFEVWRADPGIYRVMAMWGSMGTNSQTTPVEVEVTDSNIDNLQLRVMPSFDVSGTVQYDGGDGKTIAFQDTFGMNGRQFRTTLKPDGTFSLRNVPPAIYAVTTPSVAYVKSMQLGPMHVEGRVLDLRNGTGDAPLTVTLAASNAEVSGVVRNGVEPVANRAVLLLGDLAEGVRTSMMTSRGDGSYSFSHVAPGKYKLIVLDEDDQGQNPYERPDIEEAPEISIQPADRITKDLKVRQPSSNQ